MAHITKNDNEDNPHGGDVSLYVGGRLLTDVVVESLEASKAEDIVTIPFKGRLSVADFMVVASGRVGRHVAAIAERLILDLKCLGGLSPVGVEGLQHGDWVLIDMGDVIIHVLRPEIRLFYNLENMWETPNPVYQDIVDVA